MKPHTTRLVILACLGSMLLLLLAVSAPFGLRASHAYFAESARREQNQIFLTPTPSTTITPTMTLTATAAPAETMSVCHIPPGNPDNAHTITVGAAAVPAHLNHGDSLGACPTSTPLATATTIISPTDTPLPPPPPTATPPSYPDPPTDTPPPPPPPDTPQPPVKVTICHRPPGNPDKAKTITVGEAAVNAHLAHGDTLGACP